MKQPNVGEYWYCKGRIGLYVTYQAIRLCKIISVHDAFALVEYENDFYIIENTYLISKWEPNWFFRLLGFK